MKMLYWTDICIFVVFGAFVAINGPRSTQYIIGLAIGIAGFALSILARVQLGRSFSIRARATRLVTTGLYSKFRNPIYLFRGIAFLGLCIAWDRLVPLLIFLLIYSLLQIPRARKESKVLEAAFGDEYRRYKAGTWF